MPDMSIKNKKTYMVLLRSRRNNEDVLLREAYNVVEWGDDSERQTFVEGLSMSELRLSLGEDVNPQPPEGVVYHGIRIYDAPPFNTRFGSAQ